MSKQVAAISLKRKALLASCFVAVALQPMISLAQSSLPTDVPTPLARPFAPTTTHQSPMNLVTPKPRPATPDPVVTSAVSRTENPAAIGGTLKSGLDALSSRDVASAIAFRNGMPHGSLDRQILTWAIATSGLDGVPSTEIATAATDLRGWPGTSVLRRNSERALFKENPTPAAVIATFGNTRPQTTEGMILLARAYVSTGDAGKARGLLSPWWATQRLSADDEQKILKEFSGVLTGEDHQRRILSSLYNDRMQSAKLLAGPAQAQSLYNAFAAVSQKSPNAAKAIADVDRTWQGNAAYQFLKIRYLRRAERYNEATDLMLKAPRQASALVDPDAWWVERRILSRELLDLGKSQLAYKLVSAHAAESPTMAAEAEFHAGWYALRALNQPKTAAPHFARIAEISSRPISASRAFYWLGRSAEAGSGGDARDYYRRSAHFGTTFYGQLSAAKLSEKAPELIYPRPTEADRARYTALCYRKCVAVYREVQSHQHQNELRLFPRSEAGRAFANYY